MGLEEAMVVNYRKNRERGSLDSFKEGRLYKWWQDKGLNVRAIGEKFDVSKSHVAQRIKNVEVIKDEAIDALRGRRTNVVVSTDSDVHARGQQSQVTVNEEAEPVDVKKVDMLGSINIERLLRRSRFLSGLDEDIPEDVRLMEELRERYGEKVRNLQLEVAGEIREMSFREAEAYVEDRWGALVVEASNERRDRERRAVKAKLEKNGTTAILQEEKNWTHRDRLADKGKVLPKCLHSCPQPTVMVTRIGKTEEICGYGACWVETKEELEAETRRKAGEGLRKLREAREKIIKAGEEGDRYWLRLLLFLVSLNRDTRPGYLDQYNLYNRWKPIVGMSDGQVVGKLLTLVADCLCRPRREGDEVDFLQVLNAISKQYGIDRDYLLWEPEELQDVELEAAP